MEDPNILSKDDIMLNVINLRRNCVKSEQLLTGKRTYIAETKEQLDPYRFLASFVCDIYYIVQNLSNIDKSYKLPDNTFLAILNESIKIIKERNSESFIAASKLVVDLFLDKLCQRVTLSLLRKDQAKFFTAISITKARFYGTCSPECYSFLLESLPLITSVANNHKDGSLSKVGKEE